MSETPQVTVKCRQDGPILVTGSAKLVDAEGREYPLGGKENFALCRCNGSARKPFCDGSHKTNGFTTADAAP